MADPRSSRQPEVGVLTATAREVAAGIPPARPWHVRVRLGLDGLAPYHAAAPWTLGGGALGALAAQGSAIGPAWVGFFVGYLVMGAVAAWALADPSGGAAADG